MEALDQANPDPSRGDTVRRYFARLKLRSQPDVMATGWAQLPVESYFVALRKPKRSINVDRRPATEAVESLGSLFGSVRWT
jgi:hypothetical protein